MDVVVVGAGQAGLAISHQLTRRGIEHVVLEQHRVGESWRSERWDSFTLVTPNWTLQLPEFPYAGPDPDGFLGRDEVVGYLEAYERSFRPPVRTGVRVTAVRGLAAGFVVEAGNSSLGAHAVVVATGSYRRPKLPSWASHIPASVLQVHSSQYRSPAQLPDGAVLVVGTGQSGVQIAEELHEAGRRLFLSVSSCGRVPRRYRAKDIVWWGKTAGLYERTIDKLENPAEASACHPQSSGRHGGHDIYLRQLAIEGVRLLGRVAAARDGRIELADDLSDNLRKNDEFAEKVLAQLDEAVAKMGMPLPKDENPRGIGQTVADELNPIRELDLVGSGISSIVWASGYRPDFSFVALPVFDAASRPVQRRGVTTIEGLYFIGLEWLYKPKSGLLLGVGEDAEYVGSAIEARSKSIKTEASR